MLHFFHANQTNYKNILLGVFVVVVRIFPRSHHPLTGKQLSSVTDNNNNTQTATQKPANKKTKRQGKSPTRKEPDKESSPTRKRARHGKEPIGRGIQEST